MGQSVDAGKFLSSMILQILNFRVLENLHQILLGQIGLSLVGNNIAAMPSLQMRTALEALLQLVADK